MLFPTLAFGIFFLFVYFTAWSLDRENGRRKIFLLLASWFFYAQWDWRFVGLLIASAILNWGVAALIASSDSPRRRKWLVALGVALNLTILGVFKYYGFFVEQAIELLNQFGWERDAPLLQIVLPIGISFFTFQGISYVVDVHRGKTPPARSLVDVMLLMSFFPHLVAGPIVRASDLLPQFDRVAAPDPRDGGAGPAADRLGPVQEDGDRLRAGRAAGGPGVLRSVGLRGARHRGGHLRLCGADLLRLLGLFGHGHRAGGPAGLFLPAQFRPALPRRVPAAVLAALAHQPVQLAEGLSLRAAGGRP